uniref:TetR/AcrR family transcriptional regulator n=1 Tax=Vaginimicrobium propionicum TaxID=1871034 RepID=UPI000970FB55|nr:TetR/AcrR family transcriptional regulator [Vaginimicrobium propionicum]
MPKSSTPARQAIINATAELICAHGVTGTTISQIIKSSGTSVGAIYHHFANRNQVVAEVARQAISWPLSSLAAYRCNPRSPEELLGFAIDALRSAPEVGDLLIQLGAGAATDDELGQLLRQEFVQLRVGLEDTMNAWARINNISPKLLAGRAQLLVGLALGFVSQRRLLSNFDEDAYLRSATAAMKVAS